MQPAADQPVLAIDLGGTRIRTAYVAPDLSLSCRQECACLADEGPEAVIGRLIERASASLAEARASELPEPVGIGISSPGPLDARRGLVVAPPNLPGWHDVPLVARVEEAIGLPSFLERDTNVAVLAEWRHGAARGSRDAVYVTVSTGIGGGIVVDGRPLLGVDHTAGEIGHLTIDLDPDAPVCGDGSPGHVEAIGSGSAIAREGRALLARRAAPRLASLAPDPEHVDAQLVARAADAGDDACASVLARAWSAVGAMCAGLVNVLNPEVIVLGGAIALARPDLRAAVRAEIDRRAFPTPARRVRVEPAQHADDVSLIGSLTVVNERLHDPAYHKEPV